MAGIALAFPPVECTPLVWIALVPWLHELGRCRSLRAALVQGFWLNFGLGFTSAFWVAWAVPRYLGVPFVVGIVALFVHAAVHQLQLVLFAGAAYAGWRAAVPRSFAALAGAALLYTGLDWALPKLFQDSLGMAVHELWPLRQLAAVGGVPLLTAVVIGVNLGVLALWSEVRGPQRSPRAWAQRGAWIVLPMLALLALSALESARIQRALAAPERVLRVGIVQGNVPEDLRLRWARGDPEAARQSLDTYVQATRALLTRSGPPELVVWPEASFPGIFRKPENDAQLALNVAFDHFIAALRIPLIFGGYDRDDRRDRRVLRNALYFVTPEPGQRREALSPMQVYHKSILFPVGEYLPGFEEASARQWLPGAAHFAAGAGARVLTLEPMPGGPLRVGPAICYEDLFPEHAAALARAGADLLVNVSNDAWFGDFGAARGHWIHARLRSIETGLPQVRATSTGFSGLILPDGSTRAETAFGVAATRVVAVPLVDAAPPLRVRWGDWFGPASLATGLAWLGLHRRRAGRSQRELEGRDTRA